MIRLLLQRFLVWLLEGAHLRGISFGERSIEMSPLGVGDVLRWGGTKSAAAAGDLGMDTTTGRPSAFIAGAAALLDTPAAAATVDANGLSPFLVIRKSFTAGGGGVADDVTIYSGNAPFAFRILDMVIYVSTLVALATLTLRDATGGGGSALSDVLSAGTSGIRRNILTTATATIAANGTLALRRTDNGAAGEVVILIQKT